MLMEEAKSEEAAKALNTTTITAMSTEHDLSTTHRTDFVPKDLTANRWAQGLGCKKVGRHPSAAAPRQRGVPGAWHTHMGDV